MPKWYAFTALFPSMASYFNLPNVLQCCNIASAMALLCILGYGTAVVRGSSCKGHRTPARQPSPRTVPWLPGRLGRRWLFFIVYIFPFLFSSIEF
jgi:hypothetical protein